MIHHSERVREFIKAVCNPIKSKRAQSLLVQELAAHIEDQKSAYMKEGMNEDTAEELAVEEMGSPAELGEQFSRLHPADLEWIPNAVMWTIAAIIALAGIVPGLILIIVDHQSLIFVLGFFFMVLGALIAFGFITVWKIAADRILGYKLVKDYQRRRAKMTNNARNDSDDDK